MDITQKLAGRESFKNVWMLMDAKEEKISKETFQGSKGKNCKKMRENKRSSTGECQECFPHIK